MLMVEERQLRVLDERDEIGTGREVCCPLCRKPAERRAAQAWHPSYPVGAVMVACPHCGFRRVES